MFAYYSPTLFYGFCTELKYKVKYIIQYESWNFNLYTNLLSHAREKGLQATYRYRMWFSQGKSNTTYMLKVFSNIVQHIKS